MKCIAKSLVVGVIATGLFFSFLMMFAVPASMLLSHGRDPADTVLSAMPFLRHIGLPMSGLVFLATFGMSLRQFGNRRDAETQRK